jgi:hypothetical protein
MRFYRNCSCVFQKKKKWIFDKVGWLSSSEVGGLAETGVVVQAVVIVEVVIMVPVNHMWSSTILVLQFSTHLLSITIQYPFVIG